MKQQEVRKTSCETTEEGATGLAFHKNKASFDVVQVRRDCVESRHLSSCAPLLARSVCSDWADLGQLQCYMPLGRP